MNFDIGNLILYVVVLLFSVIVHEVSHGIVAGWFGDDTAKEAGRLTLNPIPHIDPVMSILMPAVLALAHLPVFGAAKPVPVNYNRMDRPRLGLAFVSIAGPISNFLIATVAGVLLYFGVAKMVPGSELVLSALVITNILLGVFNFIPIPPLDGSRVIASVLPDRFMNSFFKLDRFGFIIIFALIYMGALDPVLNGALNLLAKIFG